MELYHDYELLLSGSVHFRADSLTPDGRRAWSQKLRYLRAHNDLSIKEVASHLHISPSTVLLIEKGNGLITFGILARVIRFYAGSFQKFSTVEVPHGWAPDTAQPSGFVCANPWCSQYRRATLAVLGRTYFLCRLCSCRFPRRAGTLLYSLPFATFVYRLSRFVRFLEHGHSRSKAFELSGLPTSRQSALLKRLARCGLIQYVEKKKWQTASRDVHMLGLRWSPLLAFQTFGSKRLITYLRLKQGVHRGMAQLARRRLPVTMPALAAMMRMPPQSLSYRLNHTPIPIELPPRSGRIRAQQLLRHEASRGKDMAKSDSHTSEDPPPAAGS